jgi:dihydrofolate synthase / folylpolyglutamate synthase
MNYKETIDYLYAALPMFHRDGPAAYKASLDNTHALCDLTGNPEKGLTCIHIAGTNGKGSVAHMLASVLQAAGYKTGLYTSPHLRDFRERIRINGEMVSEEYVSDFVEKYRGDFDRIQPSFFEMSTVMAFNYFREQETDIAIIETGLGGRLDSTNVITPVISVITNIGTDHMNLLGDTIEKIAQEKAGIIKEDVPVVIGESTPETMDIFIRVANEHNAEITFAHEIYTAECENYDPVQDHLMATVYYEGNLYYKNLRLDLTGLYQLKNICTTLAVIDYLKEDYELPEEIIRKGLRTVVKSTGLNGRWQVLSKTPLTICDTGHNKEGLAQVIPLIRRTHHKQLHFVLGMVNDKDINGILGMLPSEASYYFCKADIPRGMEAEDLSAQAEQKGLHGKTFKSVNAALEAAQKNAGKDDLVFIGGSTFTVAEVI